MTMSNANILVVDDEVRINAFIREMLSNFGYRAESALTGEEALAILGDQTPQAGKFDLVLLDIMLPGINGYEVCHRIRTDPSLAGLPVIMLTAMGKVADKAYGLEMGADDYLVKPFGPRELTARIRAVLRRKRPVSLAQPHVYANGAISINLDTHEAQVNGQAIELTPIEFKLLACLVDHEGKVVSHDYLLDQVWGQEHKDARHYLKLYIWYLRQKLEAEPTHPRLILTQRGVGYRLVSATEPVEGSSAPAEAGED
jgi:DNA-binding response OmpR family regulator